MAVTKLQISPVIVNGFENGFHQSIQRTFLVVVRCVSKNDTDVTHYRFNPHQPILVIFGRDVAERVFNMLKHLQKCFANVLQHFCNVLR